MQVSGKLTTFAAHREITIAAASDVKKTNTIPGKPVTPITVHTADGGSKAGQLVRMQGVIVAGSTDYFTISDSSDINQGDVNVYIYDTSGIGFNAIASSQTVCVTGVVDPYNRDLEILPRHSEDIQAAACQ